MGADGTTQMITAMAPSASRPVRSNMPGTPMALYSAGPASSDAMKLMPMVMPTMAMALVRCSSRVESAIIAEIAAEIAPAP